MRPNPAVFALLTLAATPVLAQGVSPADRYGAASPRPAPVAGPPAGPVAVQGAVLNWSGKTPAAVAVAQSQAAPPQLIPGGVLAHSSVAASQAAPTPVALVAAAPTLARPQMAAPAAPIAAAPPTAARAPVASPVAPSQADLARMAAAAPDGLLGVPPPVRNTPAVSGAL